MRGALGLTFAAGLGIIGAFCNWFYLQGLARDQEKVYFIAIKRGVSINAGEIIKRDHLERVGIPKTRVDYLDVVAPKWAAVESVIGRRAPRPMSDGELILNQDLTGPSYLSLARSLEEDEAIRWVPIDAGTVVPEHLNPGDYVSFQVPRIGGALPTPGGSAAESSPVGGFSLTEMIGPFEIASLGRRREPLQSAESRRGGGSESRIAIVVKLVDGQPEPQAQRLFEALSLSGGRGAQVQLHSASAMSKRK